MAEVKENVGNESKCGISGNNSLFYFMQALASCDYLQICVFDKSVQFYLNK